MPTSPNNPSVSRRTALAGFAAGGVGLAQDAAEMAAHPMVGIWLTVTPEGPGPTFIMADDAFLGSSTPISVGPDGALSYQSPQNGIWEPDPDNERGIHFTSVQNIHDASGALTGTVTVDGYPVASEDGQRFHDDATRVRITFRDATNAVTMVLGEDGSLPPIFGARCPRVPGGHACSSNAGLLRGRHPGRGVLWPVLYCGKCCCDDASNREDPGCGICGFAKPGEVVLKCLGANGPMLIPARPGSNERRTG